VGDTLGGDTANSKRGGQSFKFALGKLLLHRQSAVKFEELSHSSQGVLKPFQFALKVQILQLVTIQMRLKLFRGINLGPAALTNRRVISRVIKMDG